MSKSKNKNSYALFPELNNLRRALLEVQDDYAASKPKLNEAITALLPRDRSGVLDKISNVAATPLGKTVPEKVATQIRAFRAAIRDIDGGLRQDAGKRASLFQGSLDEDLIAAFEQPLIDGKDEVVRLSGELEGASFGTRAIDLAHERDIQAQLLHVGLNALLESIDLRHGGAEEDGPLSQGLARIGTELGALADIPAAKSIWTLLSNWTTRWQERPSYQAAIAGWLPFAYIEVSPPQNVDRYKIGDIIAQAKVKGGPITSAAHLSGRLPSGLEFDSASGAIVVADPKRLVPGSYSGITFEVKNERGFVNKLVIPSLELAYDEEAVYTLIPNLYLDQLGQNDLLAYPTDPDGKMVGAQVVEGRIPPGTRFDSTTGEFRVADPLRLKPGIYSLTIKTYDELGGESDHTLELAIQAPALAAVALFHANNPIPLPVVQGATVAYISVPNGYIVGAAVVSGTAPDGVRLTASGNIVVINPQAVQAGTYTFNVSITTSLGDVLNLPATLAFVTGSRTGTGTGTVGDTRTPGGLPNETLTPLDTPDLTKNTRK